MKDISAGLSYNNYISSPKIKALFKRLPFDIYVKNININGQKRGCSGFIKNTETGKICYITTEPFFNGKGGSGLYDNPNMAIMMRMAKDLKDYTGGLNCWLPTANIVSMAYELTR